MLKRGKKGAVELSISTIVIIVLAMSMLILGLLLVKSIFSGAINNVDTLNNKVKGEIDKLFTEEQPVVLYLANGIAPIKQGTQYGVAFGIKNTLQGTASQGSFTYEITSDDTDLTTRCGITKEEAEGWVYPGRTGTFTLAPGGTYYGLARFTISKTAPLCTARFNLAISLDSKPYEFAFFDVTVH